MKTIGIRKFQQEMYDVLKELPVGITRNGKLWFTINSANAREVSTDDPELKEMMEEKKIVVTPIPKEVKKEHKMYIPPPIIPVKEVRCPICDTRMPESKMRHHQEDVHGA